MFQNAGKKSVTDLKFYSFPFICRKNIFLLRMIIKIVFSLQAFLLQYFFTKYFLQRALDILNQIRTAENVYEYYLLMRNFQFFR